MLLTKDERNRFADYLELNISTSEGIIEQMKKMPGRVMEAMIQLEQEKIQAYRLVAQQLRTAE